MRHHWWILLVLVALVVSATPARAEVVEIAPPDTPARADREPLLEPADVEKIARLQRTIQHFVVSPVSPDDAAVLVAYVAPNTAPEGPPRIPTFAFLNIQDGSQVPLPGFTSRFAPLTNISWRDARTAVFVGLNENFSPAVVTLDRLTGQATATPIGRNLPGFPLSLAPDGERLLLVRVPDEEQPPSLRSPFNVRVQLRPPRPALLRDALPHAWQDVPDDEIAASSDELKLSLFDLRTGDLNDLIGLPEGTALLSMPTWSPDGEKLAMVRTEVGEQLRGGVSLATLTTQDALGNLPPVGNPLLQNNVVDIFDLDIGDIQSMQLRATDNNGTDTFVDVSWSTDNTTLLARMQRPAQLTGRQYPIYTFAESSYFRFYDVRTQRVVGVFDAPQVNAPNAVAGTFISPGEVLFTAAVGLSTRMYYYNRTSQEFREISNRAGSYTQVLPTRFSRQVVFAFSSFAHPPELYRIGWDGEALAALTYSNVETERLNQVQVNQVSFTMRGGAVRRGYLIQPTDAPFPPRNAPVVVWQEGGPGVPMVNRWSTNVENPATLLPNFGISVLFLPLSGREGWGPAFYTALADQRNYGSIDIDEGAQAVRQMIARGYTTPAQVGVTGCSYGGYFTSQSITRYPDLYAAANTQCTLLDMITEWQTGFTPFVSYLMGRSPTVDPMEFVRDSPVFESNIVRTPTLVFHGEQDFLPVSIAETFQKEIETGGAPARMLRFASEGHGLAEPENQLLAAQEQIRWFRTHLGATAETPAALPVTSREDDAPDEATPPPDEAAPPPDEATPPPDEAAPPPDEAAPPPDEAAPPPDEAAPPPDEAAPPPDEAAPPPDEAAPPPDEAAPPPTPTPTPVPVRLIQLPDEEEAAPPESNDAAPPSIIRGVGGN
jgi:dipeptidyl aminopeptidase/acylaminoacyl peptidase